MKKLFYSFGWLSDADPENLERSYRSPEGDDGLTEKPLQENASEQKNSTVTLYVFPQNF